MTSGRYPTIEEAKATFKDGEFKEAVEKRLSENHRTTLVTFSYDVEFNPRILTRIADMIDDLAQNAFLKDHEIVRKENGMEAEEKVISNRRSDMHYSESSPYYAAHIHESFSDSNE